jgi:hypothetical protein
MLLVLLLCLFQFATQPALGTSESYHFIGADDPDEVLRITSDRRFEGRLVVLGKARLLVEDATLTVAGDLLVGEEAFVRVENGTLRFAQSHARQHALYCTDAGRLELVHSRFETEAGSLNATLFDGARLTAASSDLGGSVSWALADEATALFQSCNRVGEVQQTEAAAVSLLDCTDLLLWLTPPAGEAVTLRGLRGGSLSAWPSTGPSTQAPDDFPVPADEPGGLELRDCRDVRIGLHLQDDADVRLERCRIDVVRLAFAESADETGSTIVAGLTPGLAEKLTVEAGDLRLTARETSIARWDVQAGQDAEVRVRESRGLRRLEATGRSRLIVIDSEVAAPDAEVVGADAATLALVRCDVAGAVVIAGDSVATLRACSFLPEARLALSGTATAALLNSEPPTLRLLEAATLLEAELGDVRAIVGEEVVIPGRALLRAAGAARQAGYRVFHRSAQARTGWEEIAIDEDLPPGALAVWRTCGMSPGESAIQLRLETFAGSPLVVEARASLASPPADATKDDSRP